MACIIVNALTQPDPGAALAAQGAGERQDGPLRVLAPVSAGWKASDRYCVDGFRPYSGLRIFGSAPTV